MSHFYKKMKSSFIGMAIEKLSQVTKSLLASEAMALGQGAGVKHLIANILQQKCSLPKIPKIKYMTDHT